MSSLPPSFERIDYARYVVVPIWYRCNSKCTFCMVEQQMGELPTVDFSKFQEVLAGIVQLGRHDNLILSGGEVTTFEALEKYIRYAASLNWFKKIQIQTNARRLANRDYLQRLIGAGLNEFFISLHGLEEIHDSITQAKGGYKETMRGFENLAECDVNILTNTVLTKQNFPGLLNLLQLIARLPVSELHMWNYFPMAGSDSKDLLVDMKAFFGLLPEMLAIIEPTGKPMVFKGFPACLSLGKPGFFDNLFPLNLIDRAFWDNFDENQFGQCIYKASCQAQDCFGLSNAYVEKFGDEKDLLVPIRSL